LRDEVEREELATLLVGDAARDEARDDAREAAREADTRDEFIRARVRRLPDEFTVAAFALRTTFRVETFALAASNAAFAALSACFFAFLIAFSAFAASI
jgi:hypothetical protein